MIHRFRLFTLRNLNSILNFVLYTALMVTLILQWLTMTSVYNQSRRNEEILRGLSCILLIQPDDRTKENVTQCVRGNGSDVPDFLFNTPTDLEILEYLEEEEPVVVAAIRGHAGTDGVDGADGIDGQDGEDGKDGKITKETIVKEIPSPGVPGQPGRTPEFQYNEIKNRIEWRYVGDDNWQILLNACVLLKDCIIP